jgi:hypothetical protein
MQGAQTNVSLKRGTTEHASEVSNISVTPNIITWQGGTPDSQRSQAAGYTLAITAVQDFADPDSFVSYLLDNAGTPVTIAWRPDATEPFLVTTTFTAVPPTIGGGVNAFNESSLSFSCSKPVISRAAVPTP